MRVGGVRWTVKCPETGKMVRDLYLALRPNHTHFRSRHALSLSYRSGYLKPKERYGERAERLMDRLGAQWREPPIRPKNMQRRTFRRLTDELGDARRRELFANLGLRRMKRVADIVPPPKGPQLVESMNVIAGDPHRILLYPRKWRKRRLRTGEVHDYWRTGGCAQFRSGAVEKMTGDHPRKQKPARCLIARVPGWR